MDSDPNNPFSFEQLADKEDINSDRIQKLIHHCQTINKRARPATISLFPNLRMIDSLASQNEFNSQVMDTQRSYQDSNDFASYGDNNNSNEIFTDANESLPSGNVVELAYHTTGTNLDTLSNESLQNQGHLDMEEMGPLPVDKEWDPQSFINMQLDARYKIEAKYIASRKLEDYNEIFLKPVRDHFFDDEEDNKDFKPKFKKSENILLEPYYNCIQTKGSSFTNIIIGDNIDLKIDALLKGVEHSREIPYVMPELRNYETERLAAREYFTEQPPVEVFKKWKDIAIDEKMPQFVKIVAMLLSCSYEKSSYVDIVFTDFTTNPNGHKYGVPPQYLINEQHYMSFDDCIKARIYDNQFAKFISELKEVGHAELANELNQVGQTETFRNVSAMGIVCELTLKVTRYRDNLSLIVRKCDPLPRKQINERRWYNDKKAISNLHDLYEKTERKLSEISFSFRDLGEPVLDEYTKYFPFEISDSDVGAMIIIPPDELYFENPLNHNEDDQNTNNNDEDTPELPLEPLASTIPGLNIDISEFRLTNQTDNFNILYKLQTSDDEIFVIENVKLISWKFLYRANTVILTVTDDLTSTVVTDPTRLLRINIVNRDNLVYFCNGDEEISPLHRLDLLVNKTFNFKLQTGKLKLNDKYLLKIFCPIECTLEELKSQVEVRQSNLETNDEINNITNGSVKQEMD
ncbi:hypothetical protein C6P45_000467 [Maudiozyma exigua]|uniref:Cdc13 OB4 dimerization domain-containing protein n=1 Tax=Maudiozyma exigua TaxID=34358 RepID=A0A9P7B9B9_MAUEX|nr:hypothetical protein C6P45_000467 [Kazachstania exigua]